MVGDDAVGHILEANVIRSNFLRIRFAATLFLNSVEDSLKHIGIVVAIHILQAAGKPFEAHPCVNTLGWKRTKLSIRLAVVLDEHQVPNLDDVRKICIYPLWDVPIPDSVVVDLSARPTRSCVSHLPEVVLHPKWHNFLLWKILKPDLFRLEVRLKPLLLVATEVCRVKTRFIKPVDVDEEFPCHANGFLLEIVAKRPVPKHLEEGMVIHILSNIFKIIVLPASTDAFLGVGRTFKPSKLRLWIGLPEENRLVLVHPGVCK
mmetsp:Transcript_12418/g.19711  ORF Transcript_12418/g.19711 Transcript_12418/m.19711 type:complete len:261 (+) Transcript_12418:2066-2848(+)